MERISPKTQIVYGNANIHNTWYLPVSASHLYQNSEVKYTYTQWRLWCQPARFPGIGTLLAILDKDHLSACTAQAGLYGRNVIFLKGRLPSSPSATPRQVHLRLRLRRDRSVFAFGYAVARSDHLAKGTNPLFSEKKDTSASVKTYFFQASLFPINLTL